jgi:hypothetical protein
MARSHQKNAVYLPIHLEKEKDPVYKTVVSVITLKSHGQLGVVAYAYNPRYLEGGLGINARACLKHNESRKGWEHGSSDGAPAWLTQGSKFKLQYFQKKKKSY